MIEHKFSVMLNDKNVISVEECKTRGITANDVIGIILQTPTVGVVIAMEDWSAEWGSQNLENSACGEAAALIETSGLELTRKIMENQLNRGEDGTAAIMCWDYKCGDFQWYLPCLRELAAMAMFKDEFNEICDMLGAEDSKLDASYRWSSSESYQNHAWLVDFSNGYFSNLSKYGSNVVRAVCAFSPLGVLSTPSKTHDLTDCTDE